MTEENSRETVTMLASEKRVVSVAALIAAFRLLGLFALLPVLSPYVAQLPGSTPLLIGLAVGGYGLSQAALQIPLGMLSDRIGRKPVIIGGLLVFGLGSVVAALGDSIQVVIFGRFLQGAGAISATLSALITDGTRERVRTRSMAVFGVGIGLSFMLALVVGPAVAAYFGVQALFWVAATLALVGVALLQLLPRNIDQPAALPSWNLRSALKPELLRLDLYMFLLHAMLTATFVALPFLLNITLQIPETSHWQLYIGALLVSLTGAIPLIMRDERQGKETTVGLALILMLAGLLLLTFASFSVLPVFVALALFFAGFTFLEAALPARLSILADGRERGAMLGVFSSSQFLGIFAGGLVGGRFLGSGNPGDVFFVCALLAAIWLASSSIFRK